MAIEYVRDVIASGYNLSKINDNFAKIEQALQDAISRSGVGPNAMEADLDLNSNDLLNVKNANVESLILNGQVVTLSDLSALPPEVMTRTVYDPQGIGEDVFALTNHTGRLDGNDNLPQVPTATIKGRVTAGDGSSEDLTVDQAVEVLGLTYIKDYGSHTIPLRKFRTTFVDPSDWTSVLQAAGDSGERAIRVHADDEVVFNSQWSIDTDGQKWIGEAFDNKSQLRRGTVVDEPAILVRGERQGMRHIGIKCNSNVGMTANNFGILVARPSGEPVDLDFEFRDGYISGWFYGIGGRGRGLSVLYSLISDVRYGVNFDWPAAGTYTKDRFVGDSDTNGFRRQRVIGCEFHSVEVAGIRNRGTVGGTAQAANIHCVIEGNTSNFGKGIFYGYLGTGSVIRNNSIMNANFPAYELDGGTDWVMENNSVYGDTTPAGSPGPFTRPTNFIKMTGTHEGFVIDGFKGAYCLDSGIDMRSGDFKGIVRNIDLRDVSLSSAGSHDGVLVLGTGANTEVLAHGVTLRNAVAARSVVRIHTAASVLKHRGIVALGAATPATSGSGTITPV
jgi:hypothetical protein